MNLNLEKFGYSYCLAVFSCKEVGWRVTSERHKLQGLYASRGSVPVKRCSRGLIIYRYEESFFLLGIVWTLAGDPGEWQREPVRVNASEPAG